MKYLFLSWVFFVLSVLFPSSPVFAEARITETSASLKKTKNKILYQSSANLQSPRHPWGDRDGLPGGVRSAKSLMMGITNKTKTKEKDSRIKILKSFLEYHYSPLINDAEYIIQKADDYDVPWTLVAAIAGVESTFCKSIPINSYNCWGWNNGKSYFLSFKQAIEVVSKTLHENYFLKGLDTPEKIGPVYAPPSPNWSWKVGYFMKVIENFNMPSEIYTHHAVNCSESDTPGVTGTGSPGVYKLQT